MNCNHSVYYIRTYDKKRKELKRVGICVRCKKTFEEIL